MPHYTHCVLLQWSKASECSRWWLIDKAALAQEGKACCPWLLLHGHMSLCPWAKKKKKQKSKKKKTTEPQNWPSSFMAAPPPPVCEWIGEWEVLSSALSCLCRKALKSAVHSWSRQVGDYSLLSQEELRLFKAHVKNIKHTNRLNICMFLLQVLRHNLKYTHCALTSSPGNCLCIKNDVQQQNEAVLLIRKSGNKQNMGLWTSKSFFISFSAISALVVSSYSK